MIKRIKKKAATRANGERQGENQSGGNVFFDDCTTNPQIFQTDFHRRADIYSLRSEYWKLMSDASDILAILQAAEVDHE